MKPRICLLASYWYWRSTDLDKVLGSLDADVRVFADSGAFSAGSADILDGYAAWLKRWKHWFVRYANLDVVGSSACASG